jgi:hypothetical protein
VKKINESLERPMVISIHLVASFLFSYLYMGIPCWFFSILAGAIVYTHIIDTRLLKIHILLAAAASGIIFFCMQLLARMDQPMLGIFSIVNACMFLFGVGIVKFVHNKEEIEHQKRLEKIKAEREERNREFEQERLHTSTTNSPETPKKAA